MKCLTFRIIICSLETTKHGRIIIQIMQKRRRGLSVDNKLHSSDTNIARLNCSNKHIACQRVSIKQNQNKLILIGNMYRPPQGDIDSFIQYLENVFDDIDLDNIELFIMGDLKDRLLWFWAILQYSH